MKDNYEVAIQAAVKAGEAILEEYAGENPEVEAKADKSPLTEADRRAHAIITEILKETGIPVLSEEGKEIPYMNRSWWERCWLVDPLDGTKEFLKKNGEFTVNIALVSNYKSEFGVVLSPVLNELYYGIPGKGAYVCLTPENFLQPMDYLIQFSEPLPRIEPTRGEIRVVASRSHYNVETQAFVNNIARKNEKIVLVSKGSSLKLCMVASGEADIYPRMGPTMEWDTAAAHAVVKASGKNVYRADDNKELTYNKENLLNPFFVVR